MRQQAVISLAIGTVALLQIVNPVAYAQRDVNANRPANRVYVSQHDGRVENAIDAMPDRGILIIDLPDGSAVLSAARTMSPAQFVANEPGCYISGTGSAELTLDRPSNLLARNKIFDSTVPVRFVTGGEVDTIWFGTVGDGVTDDLPALQNAIDSVVGVAGDVYIGPGQYLIDGTIEAPALGEDFGSIRLRGANGMFVGRTVLVHAPAQKTNPLLSIQFSRSVVIQDLRLIGNNFAPEQVASAFGMPRDGASWLSEGISENRLGPYAGIVVDSQLGTDSAYTFTTNVNAGGSSKLLIDRVRIQGFAVGFVIQPTDQSTGAEDFMIRDGHILENKYGVATTGSQQRNIIIENTNIYGSYVAIDGVTFGLGAGAPPNVWGCNIGKCYRFLQTTSGIGQGAIRDCYFESVATLGMVGTTPSGAGHGMIFSGCNLSLIGLGSGDNKDDVLYANVPVSFNGCAFVVQRVLNIVADRGALFDNCQIRIERTEGNVDDVSGFFNVLRPYNSRFNMVQQRHYSGETKYYDNTIKLSSFPRRAIIFPQCRRLEVGPTVYNIEQLPLSMPARIRDVIYVDDNTMTFTDQTDIPFIKSEDLLYWKVKLPVIEGDQERTEKAIGLLVTDVRAGAVTCRILSDVDTSYKPSSVDVYIQRFVTPARYVASTTSGRSTVTFEDPQDLRVGDWLTSESDELPQLLRIVELDGTNATMHRPLSRTMSSVEMYNSKLHNLTPGS